MTSLNYGSWAIITGDAENELLLSKKAQHHSYILNEKNIVDSKSLMEHLGYRLEYTINKDGKTRYIYTWNSEGNNRFELKTAYSFLYSIAEAGFNIVGVLDEEPSYGDLYWVYIKNGNLEIKTLYYANVNNGWSTLEDVEGLELVANYPDVKEKSMIVLSTPFFTNWFNRIPQLIKDLEAR